jgi:Protein of unknown function (DUF982)
VQFRRRFRSGLVQNIGSVREAAELLLYNWHADSESETCWNAHKACLEVLHGQGDAATPRQDCRLRFVGFGGGRKASPIKMLASTDRLGN